MSPRAGVANHGLCSPPQQAAQEVFLRLEGKCPRIENREDGQGTGCTLPLSKAPALVLEHVEQVPGPEDRRAAKAEASSSSQSAHPASQGSAEVADLPGQGEECAAGGGSQGEVA